MENTRFLSREEKPQVGLVARQLQVLLAETVGPRLDSGEKKPQIGLAVRNAISGVGGSGRGLALALALANIRILTLATLKPQMGLVRVARARMENFTLWRPSSRPLCSFL